MNEQERSLPVAFLALAGVALLAVAATAVWYEYDFSTPRHTPHDGPYNGGEDGIERAYVTFWATHWQGDVEPADPDVAQLFTTIVPLGLVVIAGLLIAVALGEVPWIHRVINRRVALVLLGVTMGLVVALSTAAWIWLPQSMEGAGVDSQFAASLDDDGYTETNLWFGWYALAATLMPLAAAFLFKFQAGVPDLDVVKARLREGGTA